MKNLRLWMCLAISLILFSDELFAQDIDQYPAQVSQLRFLGKTRPLSEIAANTQVSSTQTNQKEKRREVPNFGTDQYIPRINAENALPKNGDPLYKNNIFSRSPIEPSITIEGPNQSRALVSPPDPSGDVGRKFYIHMVNGSPSTIVDIFNKDGELELGGFNLDNIWSELNQVGAGDPIVLFDEMANRWLVTEFSPMGPNRLLIIVSETEDPLGSWFAYEFQAPSFPDYPKYGIWNDAYYVTSNEFGDNPPGIPVYVLERDSMLQGAENPRLQRFTIPKFDGGGFQVATPVDIDGTTPPPAGSPFPLLRVADDAFAPGNDRVEIWQVSVNWETPGNSVLEGPFEIQTAPFETGLCTEFTQCIPQPSGLPIDALQDVVMNRPPYRNFGTHESIALNFVVDVDGTNRAGIRWMELRRDEDQPNWQLYQEGTFSPDEDSRFMGSIAMDKDGNMLLGYAVTSTQTQPSLRYTGRFGFDPLGQMTLEEFEIAEGLSSSNVSRWGDYFQMGVDPSNGETFWFTGEYMRENGWGTRIVAIDLGRDSTDLAVLELLDPKTSLELSANELVTVQVRNTGILAVDSFDISLVFDGQFIATETITQRLQPDSTINHTFSPTVNMEALRSYDFEIYTTLEPDSTFRNDTLRRSISSLGRVDLILADVDDFSNSLCTNNETYTAEILNNGFETVTSFNLSYSLNGEDTTTITWNGSLELNQSTTVEFEVENILAGENPLLVFVDEINGGDGVDINLSNNSLERTVTRLENVERLRLELLTDNFPDETTWILEDTSGNVLFTGGPYSQGTTLITEEFCVAPNGCFRFTIFDSYGDGLTSTFGSDGDFEIFNTDNFVVASLQEPNFGSSETTEFCTEVDCSFRVNVFPSNESAEGEENGRIFATANDGVPPYEFSIDGGENFISPGLFRDLPAGDYEVIVRDNRNCTTKDSVTIYACNIELAVETINASIGVADGKITVLPSGGVGNIEFSIDGNNFQSSPIFEDLEAGVYTIFARDTVGCDATLADVEIQDGSTSLEKGEFYGQHIELLPNPTDGLLRINVKGIENVPFLPIKIYNSQGRVVHNNQLVAYDKVLTGLLALHELPAGVYFIQLSNDQIHRMVKFVKR